MRVLIFWDNQAEAELLTLYLTAAEHSVVVTMAIDDLVRDAESDANWDVILMSVTTPDADTAFETFCHLRVVLPECPIVGACATSDVYRIARFMTNGMRMYVIRDEAGDFIFLVEAILASTVEAVLAERERVISEKLREEVESVRKLQESMIPGDLSSPPGYEVAARYEPSQIRVIGGHPVTLAGGDYYDMFMLDDHTMVILVGDASGHGMKACMSILTMHTLVSMIRTRDYQDTASFVRDVNNRLCRQAIVQEEGGFITLLYAILNTNTGQLQWTSAGHPIPILLDRATQSVTPLGSIDDGGLPLGIMEDAEYESHSALIPAGSRLVVYTDGLEEAFPFGDRDHDQFGIEGITRSVADSARSSTQTAVQALFDQSSAYTRGAGRHDDTSVLLVDRNTL